MAGRWSLSRDSGWSGFLWAPCHLWGWQKLPLIATTGPGQLLMTRTMLVNRILAGRRLVADFAGTATPAQGQGAYGGIPDSSVLSPGTSGDTVESSRLGIEGDQMTWSVVSAMITRVFIGLESISLCCVAWELIIRRVDVSLQGGSRDGPFQAKSQCGQMMR